MVKSERKGGKVALEKGSKGRTFTKPMFVGKGKGKSRKEARQKNGLSRLRERGGGGRLFWVGGGVWGGRKKERMNQMVAFGGGGGQKAAGRKGQAHRVGSPLSERGPTLHGEKRKGKILKATVLKKRNDQKLACCAKVRCRRGKFLLSTRDARKEER